jgi:hypothetical protein
MQRSISLIISEQFRMASLVDDTASIQHHDLIQPDQINQSMRN